MEEGCECKGECWGLCMLDLDILLYGSEIIDIVDLIIFYYGMVECEFVMVLLFEIVFNMVMYDGKFILVWVVNCLLDGFCCLCFFN